MKQDWPISQGGHTLPRKISGKQQSPAQNLGLSNHCKVSLMQKYPIKYNYRSLTKERPWAKHLTSLPKRGVGALSSVPHFATKERPCYVYSNSMPSKQIIGKNNVQWSCQHLQSQVLMAHTQHSERHRVNVSTWNNKFCGYALTWPFLRDVSLLLIT